MKLNHRDIGRNSALKVISVSIFLCLALALMALNLARRLIAIDYSQKPATTVFRTVLNQPVPEEIRNLRIAGHGVLMHHTAWMTVSASNAVVEQILMSSGLVIHGQQALLPRELESEAVVNKDARALHWDNALRLPHKDVYHFSTGTGGSGWFGCIVVNRRGHEIYMVADLL